MLVCRRTRRFQVMRVFEAIAADSLAIPTFPVKLPLVSQGRFP